jgi:hypothetical protein
MNSEGDADARQRFVDDVERAVDACLPLKVTLSLGDAIASPSAGQSRSQRI